MFAVTGACRHTTATQKAREETNDNHSGVQSSGTECSGVEP